jgi:hypothetical protein
MMNPSVQRFKDCDNRLIPFLETTLERLPEDVKTHILEDDRLQIVARENLHQRCSLRFDFDQSVRALIYLNFNMLREPEWQIRYNIAYEIAGYLLAQQGLPADESAIAEQLIAWGFEEEVDAIRYLKKVTGSKGFKIGYDWAIRQNSDYLNQHFGIYFDAWNDQGLKRISKAQLDTGQDSRSGRRILADLGDGVAESGEISPSEAILAGILSAVKETRVPESCRR